jgi:hypothetical protein
MRNGMASGKRGSSSDGTTGRRRRAPTIELTATEIETAARDASVAPKQPAAAPSTDSHPAADETKHAEETSRPRAAAADERRAWSARASSEHPSAADESIRWLPFQVSKSHLAAGLAAGAVVLVVISVLWIVGRVRVGNDDDAAATSRLAVLEVQVRDLNDRMSARAIDPKTIDDLLARLASLETATAAPKAAVTDPALAKRVTAVESAADAANNSVKSVADAVTDIERRLEAAATAARSARNRADAAATAVAELKQDISSIRTGRIERSDVDRLAGRIASLESAAKAMKDELARLPGGSDDRAVRLAVAAGALRTAVEGGQPFAAEFAAVKALADDAGALAPLAPFAAKGLPDNGTLARELSELLPAMRRAAGTAADESGFLQRLQSNAEKLVRIRPINDPFGGDPAAIIARIEKLADRADSAGALVELAKLPATVRAPAEAWITKAEARLAAGKLSRRFTAEAIAALGRPQPKGRQ